MEYIKVLKNCYLFHGVTIDEIDKMLLCLNNQIKEYKKGDFILRAGDRVNNIGIVLRGCVNIIKEDFWGNRTIIGQSEVGALFAESFVFANNCELSVSVISKEETEVLFLNVEKIITKCSASCEYHQKIIENLLNIICKKNIMLTKKMDYLAKKTTREKLLSYLSAQSLEKLNATFEIPFNREQLAEYLCVDRSAMSKELSKLKRDGILDYKKNKFTLFEDIYVD
ncbi:Crp/Fnr family transcriptional regulator [Anaerofustis stercorihominis]|uniref:Crp/Fnr family transcriptional regulator n=1 Tax=Anaerofustis stercorihominis TaxID=214853 RepID=UPI00210B634A|nr:Crp/Fnr family transcriptional regulator [Anaerofustis stercorihominis]MCQ4794793.1 Crp/Fnr family transcriptional regulator [Anaerofustis stercorihominis]